MRLHWVEKVDDGWSEVRNALEMAFAFAREAARAEESFVFMVHADDLLGRRGTGNAMVATGVLSAARTAAIEGIRGGWTANVVAWEAEEDREGAQVWAERILGSSRITGELIRFGPSHIGKALP